jgi:hypothetical protein
MRRAGLTLVAGAVVLSAFFFIKSDTAVARPNYKKQFEDLYPEVKANNKVTCNACHEGSKKTDRNEYGVALIKALKTVTGEENLPKAGVKDNDKVKEALEKLAKDEKKFGERLQAGKLPIE